MSEEKLPIVHANENGQVICPYCHSIHNHHGGAGNGVDSGQRFADCGKGEYMVIPFSESTTNFGLIAPKTEAIRIIEKLKTHRHLFPYGTDVKQLAIVFCEEMIDFSSLTYEHNVFKDYWKNVQEEIIKLPGEIPSVPAMPAVPTVMPYTPEPPEWHCRECGHLAIPEIRFVFSDYNDKLRQLKQYKNCRKCGQELAYSTLRFPDAQAEVGKKEWLKSAGIKFTDE